MRQFKLRQEKSFIKILKEPPLEKKKTNWSRRLYLAIFAVVVILLVKRVYNANMIIFAQGQIELPKQTITFPNDIKVLDLNISEGASVCTGDTLFVYRIMNDDLDQSNLSISVSKPQDWIVKERLSIQKRIDINRIRIQQNEESKQFIEESLKLKEMLLLNGIHNEYKEYTSLQTQLAEIMADIDFINNETQLLKKHLGRLSIHQNAYKDIEMSKLGFYEELKYFVSPMDGVVSDVFYAVNEICYKKAEMMTIHQLYNSTINTYFDPEEIKYLEVGDMVDIKFPDDSKSKGLVSKFFVSTYAVPSEFQKKYEPTERNIVAEVVPLNKADEMSWNNFYKMEVTVQKQRYDFSF
ncbi:MAG: hypothetical protein AAGA77_01355 [Bacteroidota bacterium]